SCATRTTSTDSREPKRARTRWWRCRWRERAWSREGGRAGREGDAPTMINDEHDDERQRARTGSSESVSREAIGRHYARADGGGQRVAGARPDVRRAQARRATAALRPATRDGRRAAIVGRAEGSVVRHERQAPRREGRGSPDRVR